MTSQELIREQTKFIRDLGSLFEYLVDNGFYVCPGELRRSNDRLPCISCGKEQSRQEMLVGAGRSWTLASRHLDGLANDLTLFKMDEDAKLVQISKEEYMEIGQYWEELSPENVHNLKKGKDANNNDIYHFERKVAG